MLVHRYAYERMVGPIPIGLVIDHLCGVTSCVNPAHLEPVTQQENVLRSGSLSAQRARMTHCLRGHPFDERNTRITRRGERCCRACDRQLARERRARKRLLS
jgi:hypothetical protein